MSAFERASINRTNWTIGLSALVAVTICLQLYEMLSGGKDTHKLALAAVKQTVDLGKQAAATEKLAKSAGQQAATATALADITRDQNRVLAAQVATMQRGQTIQNRPWVSLATIGFSKPLTFRDSPKGVMGSMELAYTLQNTGPSPALHVTWRTYAVVFSMTKMLNEEIADRQSSLCEPMRKMDDSSMETSFFPGATRKELEPVVVYPQDIVSATALRETGLFGNRETGTSWCVPRRFY